MQWYKGTANDYCNNHSHIEIQARQWFRHFLGYGGWSNNNETMVGG